jgi:hypothetical protein
MKNSFVADKHKTVRIAAEKPTCNLRGYLESAKFHSNSPPVTKVVVSNESQDRVPDWGSTSRQGYSEAIDHPCKGPTRCTIYRVALQRTCIRQNAYRAEYLHGASAGAPMTAERDKTSNGIRGGALRGHNSCPLVNSLANASNITHASRPETAPTSCSSSRITTPSQGGPRGTV